MNLSLRLSNSCARFRDSSADNFARGGRSILISLTSLSLFATRFLQDRRQSSVILPQGARGSFALGLSPGCTLPTYFLSSIFHLSFITWRLPVHWIVAQHRAYPREIANDKCQMENTKEWSLRTARIRLK
jgi:hypothetical protein